MISRGWPTLTDNNRAIWIPTSFFGGDGLRSPLLHEIADELRNLIRCPIEREMARIENVYLSVRHVPAIGFRLREVEREVILPPDHQQARLLLAHPCLPPGVGVDVGSVVVEHVALNVGLPRL